MPFTAITNSLTITFLKCEDFLKRAFQCQSHQSAHASPLQPQLPSEHSRAQEAQVPQRNTKTLWYWLGKCCTAPLSEQAKFNYSRRLQGTHLAVKKSPGNGPNIISTVTTQSAKPPASSSDVGWPAVTERLLHFTSSGNANPLRKLDTSDLSC